MFLVIWLSPTLNYTSNPQNIPEKFLYDLCWYKSKQNRLNTSQFSHVLFHQNISINPPNNIHEYVYHVLSSNSKVNPSKQKLLDVTEHHGYSYMSRDKSRPIFINDGSARYQTKPDILAM